MPPDESLLASEDTISIAVSGDIANGFIPEMLVKVTSRIILAIIEAVTERRMKSMPFSVLPEI